MVHLSSIGVLVNRVRLQLPHSWGVELKTRAGVAERKGRSMETLLESKHHLGGAVSAKFDS